MTSSRRRILTALHRDSAPFPTVKAPEAHRPMTPIPDVTTAALKERFVREAQKAACIVYQPQSAGEAIAKVLEIIDQDESVSSWEQSQIPLPDLHLALQEAGIARVGVDPAVRVGITGIDAALAATGSLVLSSGHGRYRASSLLPPLHVAVMTSSQIVPDLEQWWAQRKEEGLLRLRQSSNIAIITGPSRTADIAMQLVMGMHGPGQLHIVLIDNQV